MPTKEADNISLQNLLDVIWRRKVAIIVPTLLSVIAFSLYAYWLPQLFKAESLLAIDLKANPQNVQIPTVEEQLWAVRETVLARPLIEGVAAEFDLYPSSKDAVEDVKSQITIDVVSAKAFHVGFRAADPDLAARVANRLAESFVLQTASAQTQTITQAHGLLQSGLDELRLRLATQNEQIQAYKERVGGAAPERLGASLKAIEVLEDRVRETNSAITTNQAGRAAAVKEMAELEKRGALDPAVPLERSASQRKLDELRLDLASARAKYTEKNPEVVNLAKQVADLEKTQPQGERGRAEPTAASLRYAQLSAELEGFDQHLQNRRQELSSLMSELGTSRGQIASVPQNENELSLLMRDYATTQASYQTLLSRENVAGVDVGSARVVSGPLFTIAEPARPPLSPYSPQRARLILMGLVSGLGLGGLIAFTTEHMKTSFLNAEDFSAFSSLPVLAEIATISKADSGNKNAGRIVTVSQPTSVVTEQYLTLAAKVRQLATSPSVLAVTSAVGGEGKTLTSLNLSVALAKSPAGKVLLIDADLRRPQLHKYIGLGGAISKGFAELLLNPEDDIHKYIFPYNGVSIIPTFKRVPNPFGMLTSDSAGTLLKRLSSQFAYVVLDCPPIVPIADGHVLANLADHVLLIARARRTPRGLFKMAIESLDCPNVIGVALNDVNLKHSRYSSAYRYYEEHYQVRE